jgi:UPF0042 nucleotide-binding protein
MTARARARPARKRRPAAARFIVVTGLSGSGKSQAIRALEDLGYFCVDNMPTSLLPMFAQLTLRASAEITKAAVVIDVREPLFVPKFPRVYRRLQKMRGLNPALIFLEASDAALQRRYSETRRPHPLARRRSAREGIKEERQQLEPIRKMADAIIDTSSMTVHELRQACIALSTGRRAQTGLTMTIESFGFKHGVPLDADLVFDVRFLPNPHFVPGLRRRTGRDRVVRDFLAQYPAVKALEDRLAAFLAFVVPQYVAEGKSYLTVAIGCTGGRHRSVAVAEALKSTFRATEGVRVRVRHRDMALE